MTLTVASIDPGATGAFARWDGLSVGLLDMPVTGPDVNGHAVAELLRGWDPEVVVVETQQAMPKQGVASTFRTGANYGVILGVIACLGLPVRHVRAAEWTKALHVGSDKEKHRRLAMDTYPTLEPQLRRVKDHNRADALLLAHWYVTCARQPATDKESA